MLTIRKTKCTTNFILSDILKETLLLNAPEQQAKESLIATDLDVPTV